MSSDPIKVLQLCVVSGQATGPERSLLHSYQRVMKTDADEEIRVTLVIIRARHRGGSCELPAWAHERGVDLYEIVQRGPFDPTVFWRLSRLVRRLRPDIVHAHDTRGHWLALLLQTLHGFRLVGSTGDAIRGDRRGKLAIQVERKLLPGFDRVIATNNELAHQLCRLGCKPSRVDVIQAGIDSEAFSPQSVTSNVRAELQISSTAKVVGAHGAFLTSDDMRQVFRSVRMAQAEVGPIHLVLVDDDHQPQELARLAGEFALSQRTHRLASRQDSPAAYAAFDVFVEAGDPGTAPAVLLEAQSMEVPVVCRKFAGIEHVVEHGTTGLLFEAGDTDALSAAISYLLSHPAEARSLGAAARLRVRQQFHCRERLNKVAATYRRVMAQL